MYAIRSYYDIGVEYYFILLALQVFYTIDNKKIVFSISLYLLFLLLFSKHIIYNAGNSKLSTEHEKIYYYVNITASFLYMIFTTNLFKQDTLRYQSLIEKQSKELHESIKEISNKEKVTSKLLQELNHRVKNNLQMVSMLLSSQSLKSDNDMLRQALIDVQTRIDCISLLHNQLYKSNTDLKPDIKAYLENLTKHILNISGKEDEAELIITIPSFRVNTEIATHLGLITNELLTNALKYGTNPKGEKNRIDISIHTNNTPKEFILFVSNDISEKEVEIPESTGFGLSFVKLITKQYNGYYTYDIDERYNVSVALKIKEIETEGEVNKLEQIVYYE